MRFVPAPYLKKGMILYKDLYGFSDNLMLSKYHALEDKEIKRIQELNFEGAYICDENETDSDCDYIISDRLRVRAVDTIKTTFLSAETNNVTAENIAPLKNVVNEIIEEIIQNRNATLNMIELKRFDDYTYEHSVNVCAYSILLGVEAKLNKDKLYDLGIGSILHDIGKIFVPKNILTKPEKLNEAEFSEMKKHCILGCDYLRNKWEIRPESRMIVLSHHEREDGKGYPFGLSSDKQTFFSKIVAISDIYDALTSNRPYRSAVSPSEAFEHVMGNVDSLFNVNIVNLFLKKIIPYPVGTKVFLSNGMNALVLENHNECILRPTVKLITDNRDTTYNPENIIIYDLYNDVSLYNITIKGKLTDTKIDFTDL